MDALEAIGVAALEGGAKLVSVFGVGKEGGAVSVGKGGGVVVGDVAVRGGVALGSGTDVAASAISAVSKDVFISGDHFSSPAREDKRLMTVSKCDTLTELARDFILNMSSAVAETSSCGSADNEITVRSLK